MDNEGRESTSINYKLALRRLEEYMGKDDILFSDLTSSIFKEWIDSMKDSLYKKHGYPKRIKTMFMAGCERYNNYDTGEMLIRNNPFRGVRVPRPTVPEKRALDIRTVRDFLRYPRSMDQELIVLGMCARSFFVLPELTPLTCIIWKREP